MAFQGNKSLADFSMNCGMTALTLYDNNCQLQSTARATGNITALTPLVSEAKQGAPASVADITNMLRNMAVETQGYLSRFTGNWGNFDAYDGTPAELSRYATMFNGDVTINSFDNMLNYSDPDKFNLVKIYNVATTNTNFSNSLVVAATNVAAPAPPAAGNIGVFVANNGLFINAHVAAIGATPLVLPQSLANSYMIVEGVSLMGAQRAGAHEFLLNWNDGKGPMSISKLPRAIDFDAGGSLTVLGAAGAGVSQIYIHGTIYKKPKAATQFFNFDYVNTRNFDRYFMLVQTQVPVLRNYVSELAHFFIRWHNEVVTAAVMPVPAPILANPILLFNSIGYEAIYAQWVINAAVLPVRRIIRTYTALLSLAIFGCLVLQ